MGDMNGSPGAGGGRPGGAPTPQGGPSQNWGLPPGSSYTPGGVTDQVRAMQGMGPWGQQAPTQRWNTQGPTSPWGPQGGNGRIPK